jgi:hypothetical protein
MSESRRILSTTERERELDGQVEKVFVLVFVERSTKQSPVSGFHTVSKETRLTRYVAFKW